MASKRNTKLPKNDFAYEEDIDVCGFTDEPIINKNCISSFSFDDNSIDKNTTTAATTDIKINTTISEIKNTSNNNLNNFTTNSSKEKTLPDNRKTPIINGSAPPIDGEFLDIKRTYMLRSSTVRKLNELKSIHPELNTYVSTIVDMAIAHYYEHIVNEGGIQ